MRPQQWLLRGLVLSGLLFLNWSCSSANLSGAALGGGGRDSERENIRKRGPTDQTLDGTDGEDGAKEADGPDGASDAAGRLETEGGTGASGKGGNTSGGDGATSGMDGGVDTGKNGDDDGAEGDAMHDSGDVAIDDGKVVIPKCPPGSPAALCDVKIGRYRVVTGDLVKSSRPEDGFCNADVTQTHMRGTVSCPTGWRVASGGGDCQIPPKAGLASPGGGIQLTSIFDPKGDQNSWSVDCCTSKTETLGTYRAIYAVCIEDSLF